MMVHMILECGQVVSRLPCRTRVLQRNRLTVACPWRVSYDYKSFMWHHINRFTLGGLLNPSSSFARGLGDGSMFSNVGVWTSLNVSQGSQFLGSIDKLAYVPHSPRS